MIPLSLHAQVHECLAVAGPADADVVAVFRLFGLADGRFVSVWVDFKDLGSR